MNFAIVALVSYLLGSIPFGVVLAQIFNLVDPRTIGSGNIGATNMLRTGNKKVALLTLLLDAGKGAVAVLSASLIYSVSNNFVSTSCFSLDTSTPCAGEDGIVITLYLATALTAAAMGHMFSPWLKFKGGKGVATILGGALAFSPVIGAFGCVVWLITFLFFRYVSLASLAMLVLLPVMVGLRVDWIHAAIIALACATAIFKHHSNIRRLIRREEPKMSLKKAES